MSSEMICYLVYGSDGTVNLSTPQSSTILHRIPYFLLKSSKCNVNLENEFIIYILKGDNPEGKDFLYVGKSNSGLDCDLVCPEKTIGLWTDCYVITVNDNGRFFNDSVLQCINDKICDKINTLSDQYINETSKMSSKTANKMDQILIDKLLDDIYPMLYSLGLNLLFSKKCESKLTGVLPQSSKPASPTPSGLLLVPPFPEVSFGLTEKELVPFSRRATELINQVYPIIKELAPDSYCNRRRNYYVFKLGKSNYLYIYPQQNSLRLCVFGTQREVDDKFHMILDAPATHNCPCENVILFSEESEKPAIRYYIMCGLELLPR